MPCVSEFYGVAIYMYYNDHAPPHFHAEYGGDEAQIAIDTLEVLQGKLKRRSLAMVLKWSAMHRQELGENWDRAREGLPLNQIEPLD